MTNANNVKSIIKAFAIIEELEKNGSMSIGELSQALSMDKSTVHRLVNTIKDAGYVTQSSESQKYENSIKLFEAGQSVIERIGINSAARPHIESLAQATGETVNLAMRMENELIIIDKIESKSTIKVGINIGTVIPLYCTGMGKAVFAFLPLEERERVFAGLKYEKFTENTVTDPELTAKRLDEVRQQGYSMDSEEYVYGLICFGAPIFNHRGMPIAAVSTSLPSLRFTSGSSSEYAKLVKEAAAKISRHMGYA